MTKKNVTGRRDFLKAAAAGTAAIALNPSLGKVFAASSGPTTPSPLNKWPGKVAINFNKEVTSGDTIVPDTLNKMVDDTIQLLTGKTDIGEAWKSVFPSSLSVTSKIAVKVICYNPYKVGLNWQTVKAVTQGLQKMEINGTKFPAANIIIYELTTSPTANAFTVAGYTAANFPGITISTDKSKKIAAGDGALNNRPYAQALKDADFLINCFNARGHQLPDAGSKMTLGFKSHFGTYDNPSGMHGSPMGADIAKNIRELACVGPVYNKHVLSVCGAIFGLNEGNGPGGVSGRDDTGPDDFSTYVKKIDSSATVKNPSTVFMSTDPAAAEMQAIKILRMNKGGKYGPSDLPAYLQAAAGIDKAGFTPTYNIGKIDESKMTIYSMVNGKIVSGPATSALSHENAARNAAYIGISAHQLDRFGSIAIEFKVPESQIGKDASIEIFNLKGMLVKTFHEPVLGIVNHFSWDGKHGGGVISKGRYALRLACGSLRQASNFSIE
jgi:hypothetical protein